MTAVEGLVIQFSGLKSCQWLKKPVVHEFAATGVHSLTRALTDFMETLSCWAKRMLGRHPDHDIYFLEAKNHNGVDLSQAENDFAPKECITRN